MMTEVQTTAGHVRVKSQASKNQTLSALMRTKAAFVLPILILSVGSYLALAVLAGFFRESLTAKIIGSLNTGFFLIFCDYLLILTLVTLYVWIADTIFDTLAKQIKS